MEGTNMARTARKVTRKSAGVETTPATKNDPPVKSVTIRVDFVVSTGRDDTRSLSELREDLRKTLLEHTPAKNVTPISGYYIIGGKVCLEEDYDPETRDFKPGKYPPTWAGGPDEKEILARIQQEKALDSLSRNPAHLRTAKETKRLRELEGRGNTRTPAEALDDFYENTDRGREIVAERERAMVAGRRKSASQPEPEECEDCGLESTECLCEPDEVEEVEECDDCGLSTDECDCEEEEAVDVSVINDDAVMSEALEQTTQEAMARFKTGRKVVRKR